MTVSHLTQEEPGAPALMMTSEPSPTWLRVAAKVCKSFDQRFRLEFPGKDESLDEVWKSDVDLVKPHDSQR